MLHVQMCCFCVLSIIIFITVWVLISCDTSSSCQYACAVLCSWFCQAVCTVGSLKTGQLWRRLQCRQQYILIFLNINSLFVIPRRIPQNFYFCSSCKNGWQLATTVTDPPSRWAHCHQVRKYRKIISKIFNFIFKIILHININYLFEFVGLYSHIN